jgi:hypothetical protein
MASSSWALMMVVAGAVAAAGCSEAAEAGAVAAAELPMRLLPTWIAAFSHDPATGRFEAALEAPRTAHAEVDLRHNATVAGEIRYGNITALTGISMQDLFPWFAIRGIRVDVPGFEISQPSQPLPPSARLPNLRL